MPSIEEFCGSDISPVMVFIGGGNMASAMIEGSLKSGFLNRDQIAVSTRTKESSDKWQKRGYNNVFTSNKEMLEKYPSGVVVLSVKPHMRQAVYSSLTPTSLRTTKVVISLMAGIKSEVLGTELADVGFNGSVIRLMPNTPCAIGSGASLLTAPVSFSPIHISLAREFASSVGMCVDVDEKQFNATAAVSGCGPAWVYMFIESLADGGVLAGCSRQDAMKLAAQTVMGAAKMVLESGDHPGLLKDRVCSPAGTTIAGVRQLEKGGFRSSIIEAVVAAAEHAKSM